jgi:NTE family protein
MKFKIIAIWLLFCLFSVAHGQDKIALVLSGGGAKGVAHIGVLKELEKQNIKPDLIVGTSMGSLIGGLYSCGYSAHQIEEIVLSQNWDFILNDMSSREQCSSEHDFKTKKSIASVEFNGWRAYLPKGLSEGQNIFTLLNILTRNFNKDISFDSLPIPFRCVATNLENGNEKVFSKGKLADAMRASMSIPSVFIPHEINDSLYIDGGVVNNFPVDVAKNLGADFIIGVNVESSLYKKEELNSIVRILNQTMRFYNAKNSIRNKDICNIYIRPEIDGIETMTFDKLDYIIELGQKSIIEKKAEIEEIKKRQTNINIEKKYDDTLLIKSIIIKTEAKEKFKRYSINKLVFGTLDLKPPCLISDKELCKKINKIYCSDFFVKVGMNLLPKDSSYILILEVSEKKKHNIDLGMRFDQTYGVNLLASAEIRNLLVYGSVLESSVIIGQSPQIKLQYVTDRGKRLGFGTSLKYDNFKAYHYFNNDVSSSYLYNRGSFSVFLHSNLKNFNKFVAGIESSVYSLSPFKSFNDIQNSKEAYLSGFFTYTIDKWDRCYFPNRGLRLMHRNELVLDTKKQFFIHHWTKATYIHSITKNLKLPIEVFVGLSNASRTDHMAYQFETGGLSNMRMLWHNSFPGLQFLEKKSTNIWMAKTSLRYEFKPNHFISYTYGLTALDHNIKDLFYDAEQFYTGMSLKYGFNSMFGPLDISMDYGIQSHETHFFVSLGYWF